MKRYRLLLLIICSILVGISCETSTEAEISDLDDDTTLEINSTLSQTFDDGFAITNNIDSGILIVQSVLNDDGTYEPIKKLEFDGEKNLRQHLALSEQYALEVSFDGEYQLGFPDCFNVQSTAVRDPEGRKGTIGQSVNNVFIINAENCTTSMDSNSISDMEYTGDTANNGDDEDVIIDPPKEEP